MTLMKRTVNIAPNEDTRDRLVSLQINVTERQERSGEFDIPTVFEVT